MAETSELLKLRKDFGDLLTLLGRQQTILYALREYISEQPFYDPVRFGQIYEEFDADLLAALKRRPTTVADVALLKRLAKLKGPKH